MIVLWVILSLMGLYILLLWISSLLVHTDREYPENSRYYRWLLNSATGIMILVLRIRLKVSGVEKLPEGRFLLVSNHRSNFDPILTWFVLRKRDIAFVSKRENFDVPIFGRFIRRCCFMAIDRENPRNAIRTIDQAAVLIKEDKVSVGIYPEGTRSKDCVLLPFHPGVFKIAQKANVPVVVMTVNGTEKIHRNVPFHRTVVNLDILKVIPTEKVTSERTALISEDVRETMAQQLTKYE